MREPEEIYRSAFLEGLQPPPDLGVSDWADAERILTRRSSAEPGPWRTDRVPYLREPMDCLNPSNPIKRVVMVFGSQSAKTEAGLNWLGRSIVLDPGPFLVVFPTISFAKRQVRQRLKPLFNDTPSIEKRILSKRSRDAANTMFLTEFENDMLVAVTGSNSGAELQGMPTPRLWVDECSSVPQEADDKGDPIENAEARTASFPNRKILLTSTPGTRGECRITWEYETRSDQRRYAALMPCCGANEVIRWRENMVWDDPRGEVWCQCPACGERIAQHYKTEMLAGGIWKPHAKGDGVTAGFHLPGWYTPIGLGLAWEEIRDEFLRAKRDPMLLKGWITKRAAEAFDDPAISRLSAEGLMDRVTSDAYKTGWCPAGVLVLFASVDVQGSWLEVSVWGYGRDDESWLIWNEKIIGDPLQNPECDPTRGGPWLQVNTIRKTLFPSENGWQFSPFSTMVDTGGSYTQASYEYCRRHARDGVIAVKGSSDRTHVPIGMGRPQDVTYNDKVIKSGVKLYMVGTQGLKSAIAGRLNTVETPGPGFIHFGLNGTKEYLEGLTCEQIRFKLVKGYKVSMWENPSGGRNEPLDNAVYCLAGLYKLKRKYTKLAAGEMWDRLEEQNRATVAKKPAPKSNLLSSLTFG